ncbi:MAG: hypothetical protein M0P66_15575, partial [Salinivirgaceae bacterium]|nr:hypothetical protein [Salinivirgaceae bacterium]
MFKWEKLGRVFNPLNVTGRFWLSEFAQAPSTLEFEDFIRVYFSSRSSRDINNQFVSYSSYIDLDRKDLFKIINIADKPVLSLGNKGSFDEFGTYPFSPIRKGKEIWGYYAGWTRCESVPFNTAIGLGISRDNGKTFEKIGNGPILSYTLNEPFILSGPKIRSFNNKYYLFYIAGKKWLTIDGNPEMSTKIRVAISEDGVKWDKQNTNLILDKLSEDEAQASPDVFFANDKYHMFFCYWDPNSFRKTKARRIGYASSLDLINWVR